MGTRANHQVVVARGTFEGNSAGAGGAVASVGNDETEVTFATADCVDVEFSLDWRFTSATCLARIDSAGMTVDRYDETYDPHPCRLASATNWHLRLPPDGCSRGRGVPSVGRSFVPGVIK